ncbi:hypothetical protein ISCGN_014000 [Ixodes scapularis]
MDNIQLETGCARGATTITNPNKTTPLTVLRVARAEVGAAPGAEAGNHRQKRAGKKAKAGAGHPSNGAGLLDTGGVRLLDGRAEVGAAPGVEQGSRRQARAEKKAKGGARHPSNGAGPLDTSGVRLLEGRAEARQGTAASRGTKATPELRSQLSTQDILLQLKEDILDNISRTTTQAVLALDVKGAFDNVSHTTVLQNLASTNCGQRTYKYVRDFLKNRTATIGTESIRSDVLKDVLLQIKEDILDRISCTTTRAVLALDIKGAFDNVSHTLVFENLASTGCGPRMYDYVRDFLSNWMATIGIESIRTSTIPIPSKGNRQGSVLSPTFGRQDFLEEVIETVQNYLEAGNLQRAPDKSQLLLLRAGKPIPEEEEGGHPPHRDGGAKYTVDRLVKTTTQVMRMVRRITSHRHGLEESDLIRLTQPLVVSHIACANPYLNLLSRGKGKMDVIIRKGY